MTDRIKKKLEFLKAGEYRSNRKKLSEQTIVFPDGTSQLRMSAELFRLALERETPFLFEDDRFGFNRSYDELPMGVCEGTLYKMRVGNITVNYAYALSSGMDAYAERIKTKLEVCTDEKKREFYECALTCIEAALNIADRYCQCAKENKNEELYRALCVVPHKAAQTFEQACIFMKFIQYTLRCNRNDHVTLGGFDKYMLPYFEADLTRGISEEELFETLEDFFITLNLDSDVYYGVQKGDNGMSMVLGGRDIEGRDRYNKLSELCIKASMELCLIDPKINLRVDRNTPIDRLEFASELTKKGLGFPQYCNDDVVIPGLIKLGYAPEDACEYTVAACWEFIIPGKSFDVPNIDRVNFPSAAERAVKEYLNKSKNFEEFFEHTKKCICEECHKVAQTIAKKRCCVSPYLSVFVDDCIERGADIFDGGAIYNNYGAHGVGIATAADIIAAVKKAVYDDKKCTATELLKALQANFEGYAELRNYLLECPKMGNNDDYVDCYAGVIMDIFADVFAQYKNVYGGILRPGTGSALEYLMCAAVVGATPDGRYAGSSFGTNFSPTPITRLSGPLSCIQSFTKYDLTKVINGGPLTMEIHDSVFRNSDGVKKVAALVKAFIGLGGHQLQLNSINREILLDAQRNPEAHKNLIVRVWGWSGYFNELDLCYQQHVISRTEFTF